jgi:hypothetical protein
VLDDARVVHESTPIQPLGAYGHRDTLVLTYRSRGFQGPGATQVSARRTNDGVHPWSRS